MTKTKSTRLKPDVYVKAAEIIDDYDYSCHAVTAAACRKPYWNPLNPYTVAYQDTFAMSEDVRRYGWKWSNRISTRSTTRYEHLRKLNEVRILALLFMAEFARTEKL